MFGMLFCVHICLRVKGFSSALLCCPLSISEKDTNYSHQSLLPNGHQENQELYYVQNLALFGYRVTQRECGWQAPLSCWSFSFRSQAHTLTGQDRVAFAALRATTDWDAFYKSPCSPASLFHLPSKIRIPKSLASKFPTTDSQCQELEPVEILLKKDMINKMKAANFELHNLIMNGNMELPRNSNIKRR